MLEWVCQLSQNARSLGDVQVDSGIVASGPHSEVKHLGNGPIPSEQVAKGSDVKTNELGPLKERFEVPNGSVDSEDGIYF